MKKFKWLGVIDSKIQIDAEIEDYISSNLSNGKVAITNANGKLRSSTVGIAELALMSGASSNLQDQLDEIPNTYHPLINTGGLAQTKVDNLTNDLASKQSKSTAATDSSMGVVRVGSGLSIQSDSAHTDYGSMSVDFSGYALSNDIPTGYVSTASLETTLGDYALDSSIPSDYLTSAGVVWAGVASSTAVYHQNGVMIGATNAPSAKLEVKTAGNSATAFRATLADTGVGETGIVAGQQSSTNVKTPFEVLATGSSILSVSYDGTVAVNGTNHGNAVFKSTTTSVTQSSNDLVTSGAVYTAISNATPSTTDSVADGITALVSSGAVYTALSGHLPAGINGNGDATVAGNFRIGGVPNGQGGVVAGELRIYANTDTLSIGFNNSQLKVRGASANEIGFYGTNGTINNEYMRICNTTSGTTTAGNVGIGLTSPSAKLEVNGTVKCDDLIFGFTGAPTTLSTALESYALGNVMGANGSYDAGLVATGSVVHNDEFLRKDDTWQPPTDTDTNTEYDVMGANGSYDAGLVATGSVVHNDEFLRKDGTWQTPTDTGTNTEYGVMGANGLYDAGLVATGSATHNDEFLRKDGTRQTPTDTDTNTEYSAFSSESAGLVPASGGTSTTKFLNQAGSFVSVPEPFAPDLTSYVTTTALNTALEDYVSTDDLPTTTTDVTSESDALITSGGIYSELAGYLETGDNAGGVTTSTAPAKIRAQSSKIKLQTGSSYTTRLEVGNSGTIGINNPPPRVLSSLRLMKSSKPPISSSPIMTVWFRWRPCTRALQAYRPQLSRLQAVAMT